jgi:aspartate kinase
MEKIIEGITVKTDLAKVMITSVPDTPGSASILFSNLGEAGFNIETITQNSTAKNFCDITFTIKESEAEEVVDYIRNKLEDFQTTNIITNKNIALVTIYGEKIAKTAGVAGKIFSTVAELKINIENITAGMTMISFVVPKDKSDNVVKAIKAKFEM